MTSDLDVFGAAFPLDASTERLAVGGRPRVELFTVDGGAILKGSVNDAWTSSQSYHLESIAGAELLAVITNTSQSFYNVSADQSAPTIQIVQPDPVGYNTTSVTVTGAVSDPSGVSSAESRIGAGPWETLSLAAGGQFEIALSQLAVGDTVVAVRARDTRLNFAESAITVTRRADLTAPLISNVVSSPLGGPAGTEVSILALVEDSETGVVGVSAEVSDETGVAVFSGPMVLAPAGMYRVDVPTSGWLDATYFVTITASDAAAPVNVRVESAATAFVLGAAQPLFAD
jgi:hypothetical protein